MQQGAGQDLLCDAGLPEPPPPPLEGDCCGGGCSPCVWDLYERDLAAWRRHCQEPAGGAAAPVCAALRPDQYTALALLSETPLTADSSLYRIQLPDSQALNLPVGAHLLLRDTSDDRTFTRAYTPVSPAGARGYFDVYVRRYRQGAMSRQLRQWQPGVTCTQWRGPCGGYTARPHDQRLVLLAAGTGVAPMLSVIRHVLNDEEAETRLVLALSVRSLDDVYPRDELRECALNWNFSYVLFVSGTARIEGLGELTPEDNVASVGYTAEGGSDIVTNGPENLALPDVASHKEAAAPAGRKTTSGPGSADGPRYGEPVRWRRLAADDVRQLAAAAPPLQTRYLVCGPQDYEKQVLDHLATAGVAEDDVFRF